MYLPAIHKSHPQTTPAETVERIRALALEHPAYGCNRIEALLALEGRRVSAIAVQEILNDHVVVPGGCCPAAGGKSHHRSFPPNPKHLKQL